jgi:AcrR family transcriptional regulator
MSCPGPDATTLDAAIIPLPIERAGMARRAKTPVRKAGRPTRESAAALRERLLRASLEEFLASGYEGASLNRIAQTSGVSRDTIYRQYSGKPALFLAASGFAFDSMADHLQSVIDPDGEPATVLRNVVRFIHDDTRDPYRNRVVRLVMQEAWRIPELASDVVEQSYRFVEPLAQYLERQKAGGRLHFGDARETALTIAVLVSGGGHFYVDQPHGARWLDDMLHLLLHGLAGTPAEQQAPATRRRRAGL